MLEFLAFIVVGGLAGFLAGLLGIGGGLVIVPALAALLAFSVPEHAMHLAVATSLASILLTGSASVYAHHRHGAVEWSLAARLAPALVIGSLAGAWIASLLSGPVLAACFGIFCLLAGYRMWRGRARPGGEWRVPGLPLLAATGMGIGVVSAIVGIGGGTLTVPFLLWRGVSIHRAVATSAACGLPIAAAGMAGFMGTGAGVAGLPEHSIGYVWLPALAGIGLASVIAAPLGARAAHRAPRERLQGIFGLFLVVLGLYLVGRILLGG